MSTVYTFEYGLAAADADGICESQTLSAGGAQALALDGALVVGGVAALDAQRRVIITSAGNDSGITFTVVGLNDAGQMLREDVPGADTDVATSTQDFRFVSEVIASGNTAAGVTVGTSGVGASRARPLSLYQVPMNVSLALTVDGTVSYTVQYSFDSPFRLPQLAEWFDHPDLTGKTDEQVGNIAFPVTAVRLLVNSGTGKARFRIIQGG